MSEETLELDPFDPEDESRALAQRDLNKDERVDFAQHILRDRRDAYLRFFGGTGNPGDKRLVMEDLRKFCRGGQTTWADDARLHALLTGRNEVYQRIIDHLELNFDDLWTRYSKVPE